ncbi:hypothetical protein Glove_242g60 [Diversispora epigaea]|uniref:Crinkler effector protein N-terminal domain-containing protein n=1 Tax=Diversispora epigaea TaxID=1348612 RepID=A0A397IIP0_9GLOM|nr:hypothetical protein Glove_242g60 [Diversispora epigaea]
MKTRSKKAKKVPSTIASTSGTSGTTTQSKDAKIIEKVENVPLLRKEQSISSGFKNFQLGLKIWVKYVDSQPTRISFKGEIVDDLKEAIKKKLPNELGNVDVNRITLRRHSEDVDLRPGLPVDESFKNDDESPLQVIVNAPTPLKRKREESEDLKEIIKSAIEEFSQQNQRKVKNILDHFGLMIINLLTEDFQNIEPIKCKPFLWDMEISKDHQMSKVEKWFNNVLNLPREFHAKNVHTKKNKLELQNANVILIGGTDISIEVSGNPGIWIETKKRKENFKMDQAIEKLMIMNRYSVLNPMSVLTDYNDNWIIFFFLRTEGNKYLATSEIDDHGIALAIIKQFILNKGETIHKVLGKSITYKVDLSEPLTRRTKFYETITEKVDFDNRMTDLIDDMTEKELYNMSMQKKLIIAKNIIKRNEHSILDKLISKFSDNYEISPPPSQMFV